MSKKITKKNIKDDNLAVKIKTPQELVHIRHNISLCQYKYWLMMLNVCHEVKPLRRTERNNLWMEIPYSEIEKNFGYRPPMDEVESDLETLRSSLIIYNMLGKDGDIVKSGAGFILQWRLEKDNFGFTLPDFILEVVDKVDLCHAIFQKINLMIFCSFHSKYEAFLYKLCRDYAGINKTPWMTVDHYKDYMGVDKNEYVDFKELNRNVITGPLNKVNNNEYCDIIIEANFKKIGRRVIEIQFTVNLKAIDKPLPLRNPFDACQIKISPYLQSKYMEGRSYEQVARSIECANQYITTQQNKTPIASVGGIYRTAIEGNWGEQLIDLPSPMTMPVREPQRDQRPPVAVKSIDYKKQRETETRGAYKRHLGTVAIKLMLLEERLRLLSEYADEQNLDLLSFYDPKTDTIKEKIIALKFDLWLRETKLNIEIKEDKLQEWLVTHEKVKI